MKKLPIGIQTFSELIRENYLYIDKTREIYKLLANGGKHYFLSRPRRFGKSLLLSTLKEIFSGNKKLFEGLWIYDKIEWKRHPVLHIDFSRISYKTPEMLEESLVRMIDRFSRNYNVKLSPGGDSRDRFGELIEQIGREEKVVILVDEYDKPIIDFLDNIDTAKKNRSILKDFYGIIKGMDEYIKFAFLTGVSKFSRVSVFSGLNNLNDITIDDHFAALLGYTQDELLSYFGDRMETLSKKLDIAEDDLLDHLKRWFNGYSWDGITFLYNPFSILNLFAKNRFGNYWFASGTPTFLINHIKNKDKDIMELEEEEVDESMFESYDIENLEVVSLLFQTGYLTIKGIKPVGIKSKYILSYPNEEVKESFLKHFLADYSADEPGTIGAKILDLVDSIRNKKLETFFTIIRSIYAAIPSHIFIKGKEAYYHTIIYLILTLLGVSVDAEVHTNKGRIDAVVNTDENIYIMEFKMGTSAEALAQIENMKYHEKFLSSGKSILLVGVGFDEKERNVSQYEVKPFVGMQPK